MVGRQDQSASVSALSEAERAEEATWHSEEREFLAQLGAAMRHARQNREMSRRDLARRSGVSERYIAMIEAGKGNVSIVLLIRLLKVFRSDVSDAA
ncbi:helix-turn-helix domain-containing protein [Bradyrhizobium jicamae]|uniref:helix-turn-helix domain-containing protein n=1 Tax=Bradyrhizobium jicamae TaxID=280332 RepID=UPI0032DEF568